MIKKQGLAIRQGIADAQWVLFRKKRERENKMEKMVEKLKSRLESQFNQHLSFKCFQEGFIGTP